MFSQLLSIAALLASVLAVEHKDMPSFYTKNPYIAELTPDNFNDYVYKTNYTTAVEFYAPWCGYCAQFRNDFKKAAKAANDFVQFGAVDCNQESNRQLCSEYRIEGFPTVLVFRPPKFDPSDPADSARRRHSSESYTKERAAKPLIEMVKGRVKNYVRRVSADRIEGFLDMSGSSHNKTLLISDRQTTSPMYKAIAIDFLNSIDFGYMNELSGENRQAAIDAIPELGANFTAPKLVVLSHEEGTVLYDGPMDKKSISLYLTRFGTAHEGPASEKGAMIKSLIQGKVKSFKDYRKKLAKAARQDPVKDEL